MVFIFYLCNIKVHPIDEPPVNNDSPRLDKTGTMSPTCPEI